MEMKLNFSGAVGSAFFFSLFLTFVTLQFPPSSIYEVTYVCLILIGVSTVAVVNWNARNSAWLIESKRNMFAK